VADYRGALTAFLRAIIEPGDLVVGPLDCDGHPDHDAAGAVVRSVADECGVASALYPIWAWHWHCPDTSVITARGRRFDLPANVAGAKANATRCFVSQTATSAPVLPSHFLARFATGYEVLVIP
jgi:LmbE family N-acetylglucosaminyl deacetylase